MMQDKYMQSACIADVNDLEKFFPTDKAPIQSVISRYPMKITPYFSSLIKDPKGPLGRQVIPDPKELDDDFGIEDPLREEKQSPVRGIVHRYPDRVLFLVSRKCAVHCRYCMRKRIMGKPFDAALDFVDEAISYIGKTKTIREVVLSGGDPLLLTDDYLGEILDSIKAAPHVKLLRIHTRAPGVLPGRITPDLVCMLKRFHPLFVNIQFNHPDEITQESAEACRRLADAGIPLGSQTVLLSGVNDNIAVMERLFSGLLAIRVRPYYLHHPDIVKGTGHFRTSVDCGRDILKSLQGKISGMAIPRYMIDLPGGGGKVPLLPDSVVERKNGRLFVRSFNGRIYEYPEK
jgi:lysine 2,3-aminomutase